MSPQHSDLLTAAETESIHRKLEQLGAGKLDGSSETLLASAVLRDSQQRGQVTLVSLGMGALALAVAVVIGSLGVNPAFGLFLIGYLVFGGFFVLVGVRVMHRAAEAEAVKVIILRRLEIDAARANDRIAVSNYHEPVTGRCRALMTRLIRGSTSKRLV